MIPRPFHIFFLLTAFLAARELIPSTVQTLLSRTTRVHTLDPETVSAPETFLSASVTSLDR